MSRLLNFQPTKCYLNIKDATEYNEYRTLVHLNVSSAEFPTHNVLFRYYRCDRIQ